MVTCAPERVAQSVSGAIGILGGTFDPVHHGHLRLALEVREALGLTEVRLIPTASTHLRTTATASPEQRLTMLSRAVAPGLVVDDRELVRGGRSYTIDTLISLRHEFPSAPLCFILGADTWNALPRWHRWQELLDYAHLIVATRPGVSVSQIPELLDAHTTERGLLTTTPAGYVCLLSIPLLPISATDLRARRKAGRCLDALTPPAVVEFIEDQRLYLG